MILEPDSKYSEIFSLNDFFKLFDRVSILSLVIRRGNDGARRGIRTSQKIGLVPVLR